MFATIVRANGLSAHLGSLGKRVITNGGAQAVAAAFASATLPQFAWHALGIGTVPESVNDTDLDAPVGARALGTQGTSGAAYTTVGTVTPAAPATVTEWGLFSASAGGTLFDRITFIGIALDSGDSLQITYVLTVGAGG